MSTITRTPTAHSTPDAGQGGSAVSGDTDTGHGSTTTSQVANGTSTKSCIWTTFLIVTQQIKSIKLKFDYTEDGLIAEGSTSFRVQYSLNGGGSFNTIFTHVDVNAPNSASVEVNIPPQDVTQIQVRDRMQATSTADPGGVSITTSISNIQLEIELLDGTILIMF
jgi:hypothetical protein